MVRKALALPLPAGCGGERSENGSSSITRRRAATLDPSDSQRFHGHPLWFLQYGMWACHKWLQAAIRSTPGADLEATGDPVSSRPLHLAALGNQNLRGGERRA